MKRILFILLTLFSANSFAQKDSLQLGDSYWEDQIYMNISYNVLKNQPDEIRTSGFSYGFSIGYIKDIPFTKRGNISLGVGLGYGFDSFNHGLKITGTKESQIFEVDTESLFNTFKQHTIEMPIQFRWRTSNAVTYSFWRVYTGVSIQYNLYNGFSNSTDAGNTKLTNISAFNNWQTALTLSAGYGTFNFYVSYGLSSIFKNATLNGNVIDTKILKLGLSFYLL